MKTLIIAEKPSVATDYYEGDEYIVGNALGHLLELACPEKYEVKRGKWTFAHLPVLPPEFDLKPIAKSAEKLKNLGKLIRRSDVGTIVNACDAGREGELIFRYIMQATKAKKPIKRLWLQSMTPGAIREAMHNLRSDEEMQPLAEAAKSRSEADWLVGINGTRAMTAFNSQGGGFFLTTVGRVQTPTLAIVVQRENEIRAFKPKDYWEVNADFSFAGGSYSGRWFDAEFKKDPKYPELKAERLFSRDAAEAVVARCRGKKGTVTESSKRTKPTISSDFPQRPRFLLLRRFTKSTRHLPTREPTAGHCRRTISARCATRLRSWHTRRLLRLTLRPFCRITG